MVMCCNNYDHIFITGKSMLIKLHSDLSNYLSCLIGKDFTCFQTVSSATVLDFSIRENYVRL